jgi:signal transduction histidine kinase
MKILLGSRNYTTVWPLIVDGGQTSVNLKSRPARPINGVETLYLDAMHTNETMSDPFGEIRAALHTGDFATDLRSWVISGVAFAVAALGAVMLIGDIRDGEYLVAATIASLPLLMIVCIWLLTNRRALDASANVLVVSLYAVVAAPMILAGGYEPGAYVGVAVVAVIANIITGRRVAIAMSIACVLLPLIGLWLTTRSWQFPVVFESGQFMPRLVRMSVVTSIVIPVILTLFRISSDRTRDDLIAARRDAEEAGEMLSNMLVEHVASIHLLARLQVIGKLGGWWFSPKTRMVHHTVGTVGAMKEFHLDDSNSDTGIDGMSQSDLQELIAEVLGTRQPWDKELKIVDSSGRTKWYRSIGELEFDGDEILKIYGVLHDVSEVREAQAQQANGQKLEAIGTLAAGMAHEINTPAQFVGDNLKFLKDAFDDMLALNKAYSTLVEAAHSGEVDKDVLEQTDAAIEDADPEFLTEEIPAALDQSIDGISRISYIVRAMKEFAHPSGEAWEFADLNKIVNDMITVSTNEWKYSSDIETELAENLPPIPCAPQDIAQVVLNLIVNAAHAIADTLEESPSDKGVIRICTAAAGDAVELRISDNGCGIPEELRERVFEPFFTTKEVGQGTGQGLAMAHKTIVGKHRGKLRLESTPGQGTTFIIRLPLKESEEGKEAGTSADIT